MINAKYSFEAPIRKTALTRSEKKKIKNIRIVRARLQKKIPALCVKELYPYEESLSDIIHKKDNIYFKMYLISLYFIILSFLYILYQRYNIDNLIHQNKLYGLFIILWVVFATITLYIRIF